MFLFRIIVIIQILLAPQHYVIDKRIELYVTNLIHSVITKRTLENVSIYNLYISVCWVFLRISTTVHKYI